MQVIPITADARQSFIVRLGAQDCRVAVWWQPSDQNWYLTLESPPSNALTTGRRIAPDAVAYRGEVFSGVLFCRSVTGRASELGRDAWGVTHELIHIPPDDNS